MSSSNYGRKGTRRCVVFGCTNSCEKGYSLHKFPPPSDPTYTQWVKFVKLFRDTWNGPTKHSSICSAHFSHDSYPVSYRYAQQFGQVIKRLSLLPGAVPTVHPAAEHEAHFEGGVGPTAENPDPIQATSTSGDRASRNDGRAIAAAGGRKLPPKSTDEGTVMSQTIAELAAAADTDSAADEEQLGGAKPLVIKPEEPEGDKDSAAGDSFPVTSPTAATNGRKRMSSWGNTKSKSGENVTPEVPATKRPKRLTRKKLSHVDSDPPLPTPPSSASGTPRRRGRPRRAATQPPIIETELSNDELDSHLNFSTQFCLCEPDSDPSQKSGSGDYRELKTHLRECLEVLEQTHDRHCKETLVKTKLETCLDLLNLSQSEMPFIPIGELTSEPHYGDDEEGDNQDQASSIVADGPGFRIKLEPTWDSKEDHASYGDHEEGDNQDQASSIVADRPGFIFLGRPEFEHCIKSEPDGIKLEPTLDSKKEMDTIRPTFEHDTKPDEFELKVTKVKSTAKSTAKKDAVVFSEKLKDTDSDSAFSETIASLNTLSALSESLASSIPTSVLSNATKTLSEIAEKSTTAPIPSGSVFPTPILQENTAAPVMFVNNQAVIGSARSLQGADQSKQQ